MALKSANQITLDEHDEYLNVKKTSLISAATIYAVVNTSAGGGTTTVTPVGLTTLAASSNFIGLATVTGGALDIRSLNSTTTLYAVVNTAAVGQSSIVLDAGANFIGLVSVSGFANPLPVTFSGNVTLDDGSLTGIVGNVTLSDSKGFIGLVSVAQPFNANVSLGASAAFIGLVSVSGFTNPLPVSATNLDIRDLVVGDFVSAEPDGTALSNGQIAVDTTAGGTTIIAASAGRQGIAITNQGSVACYVGTGTVTTSNGFLLSTGESIALPTDSDVKAITASGSTTVGYLAYA